MRVARRSHRAASAFAAAAAALTLAVFHPARVRGQEPTPSVQALHRDIDATISASPLEAATWSVDVRSLARHDTLYELNARKLLIPSSNMKIVTLAAAGERLGWDFTFETKVSALGNVSAGVLNGDLLVIGSGDPTIENWAGDANVLFKQWADEIKAAGIQAVSGRLVGDDRAFADEGIGSGWAWDDLDRSYATPVGALQFNENTAQIRVAPGTAVGTDAIVTSEQRSAGLVIRNLAKTSPRSSAVAISTARRPGTNTLDVRGTVSLGTRPFVRNVSVVNPTMYFVNELRDALIADGVEIRGPAVDVSDIPNPPASARATPVVVHRSPPLSELAGTMMRLSQNLYAETLLRALGVWAGTPSTAGGVAAVRKAMSDWGIPESGYSQADGSGLSPYNLASADALAAILAHVDADPRLRDPFRNALPAAGRDGTLENRMKGTPAQGNARAKTGSLTNARSLSGYVTSAEGEPLEFSIIVNNYGVPAEFADKAIDTIVVRLAQFRRANL
jgi:D-alanyl-D-alanine carboxypeptidase/D-alanyl-D-alanine-endopeptidase (penicillin-binding protein 4)